MLVPEHLHNALEPFFGYRLSLQRKAVAVVVGERYCGGHRHRYPEFERFVKIHMFQVCFAYKFNLFLFDNFLEGLVYQIFRGFLHQRIAPEHSLDNEAGGFSFAKARDHMVPGKAACSAVQALLNPCLVNFNIQGQ